MYVLTGNTSGGKLLNNQTIVDYGLALMEACWNTYASTAYVLSPILTRL